MKHRQKELHLLLEQDLEEMVFAFTVDAQKS